MERKEGVKKEDLNPIFFYQIPGFTQLLFQLHKVDIFSFQGKVIFVIQKAIFKLSVRNSGLLLRYLSKTSCFVYTAPYSTSLCLCGHLGVIVLVVYLNTFLQPRSCFKLRQMLMSCYCLFTSRRQQEGFVLFS